MLTLEQGQKLVKLARKTVESHFSIIKLGPLAAIKKEFSFYSGCFVTIYRDGELRGCIGFPEPEAKLSDAIVDAALHAAFRDPRFPAVVKSELGKLCFEVSVLTKPERIYVRNPEDYLKQIKIGKDGLIVRSTFTSGLLLPQVATEYGWDALAFLRQTCLKAQLKADDWQDFDLVRLYKFHSQVFSESKPKGDIIQIM